MRSSLIVALAAGAFISACASPPEPAPAPTPPPVQAPPQINPADVPRPAPSVVTAPPPMPAGPVVGSPADFAAKTNNGRDTRVFFDTDKTNLKPEAIVALQAQASFMKANPNTTYDIEGNADERGTTEYNQALSGRRAQAVVDYLVGQGVAASRLKIVPNGESKPIATGTGESAWSQNRNGWTKITSN
jgi:peptidoglycan-associated lipoprotein